MLLTQKIRALNNVHALSQGYQRIEKDEHNVQHGLHSVVLQNAYQHPLSTNVPS